MRGRFFWLYGKRMKLYKCSAPSISSSAAHQDSSIIVWSHITMGEMNTQSQIAPLYGGTVALVFAATLAVALRLVARRMTLARYWWDDLFLTLALVGFPTYVYIASDSNARAS